MERIIETCIGKFRIEGDKAYDIGDDERNYRLPSENMTDEEIVAYFDKVPGD